MESKKKLLNFDPSDYDGMLKIMDEYGDSEFPFEGKMKMAKMLLSPFQKIT